MAKFSVASYILLNFQLFYYISAQTLQSDQPFPLILPSEVASAIQTVLNSFQYLNNRQTEDGVQSGKILNALNASRGQFPYIVSLKYKGSHTCGGVILDSRHILSAAHCFGTGEIGELNLDPGSYHVTAGEYDLKKEDATEQYLPVESICLFPQYNESTSKTKGNDIAIIKLSRNIKFSRHVNRVTLPSLSGERVDIRRGTADIAGWGIIDYDRRLNPISPSILQATVLSLYDPYECEVFQGDPRSIICVGDEGPMPRSICQGDSGGPLICSGVLCGIASAARSCELNFNARHAVYTRVAYFSNWIFKARKNGLGSEVCYKPPKQSPFFPELF